MKGLVVHRSSLLSYCILGTFLLIFINNTNYFLNIGVSIRPYFIPLFGLGLLLPHVSKAFFYRYKFRLLSFCSLLIWGLVGHLFVKTDSEYLFVLNQMLLLLIQILTFYWVLRGFHYCNLGILYRGMLKILPCVTVIPLLIFIIQYPLFIGVKNQLSCGIFTGHDGIPRMIGLFADPNYFSLYMFSFLCMVYYLNQKCGLKFTVYSIFFICIGIFDILLSLSRSAWGVLCLFLLLVAIMQRRKMLILVVFFIVACIILMVHFMDPLVLDVILQRFESTGEDGSSSERIFLLQKGLESPVYFPMGVGIGNCQYYYSLFFDKKLAHNDWISVLIECGLLGVVCYAFIWIQNFLCANGLGKNILFCVGIYCCTLTCYGYEPIIPILLAFFSFYSKS